MYETSASAKSEKPQPSSGCAAPNDRHAKNAPAANSATWIARNPMGGTKLTKSPNGMASHSFLPDVPALRVDPVDDDAGEDDDHPDHDDEVREVLLEGERTDELVVDRVEDRVGEQVERETGSHDGRADLRGQRHGHGTGERCGGSAVR